MVHPVSSLNESNLPELVSPTQAVSAVVQGVSNLIGLLKTNGQDYLAELSPSQVIGRLDYINAFAEQIPNSSLAKDVSQMINTLEPLVEPYQNLPQSDLGNWIDGGQTSFSDYQFGTPIPSFSDAFNSLISTGENLTSDLKGFTLTSTQYNTGIQKVFSNIIDTMNTNGYGIDPSNAFVVGGIMTSMSDDPLMSVFPGVGSATGQQSTLAADAFGWGSTWGVDQSGIFQGGQNYTAFCTDFTTFLTAIEKTPYGQNLPPFNPPAAPSSPPES